MKFTIKKYILLFSVVAISFFPLAFDTDYFEISKNMEVFASLYKELNYYYVEDIKPAEIMKKGIVAMLKSLDPYTNFISEAEIEDYRFQTTGKYGGIGALIRTQDDFVQVAEPYEGFPADKAGLRAGDIILEIDGVSAEKKNTSQISKILKGQPGTEVKILISRNNGKEKSLKTLVREEIKVKSVPYYGIVSEGIGYIRLNSFTQKSGKSVGDALKALKTESDTLIGVIFDLRGNPGGLLNEAVNVSNIFIPKGQEVVSTRGKIKEWDKSYPTLVPPIDDKIKLAVLVNRGSASASEIVSGVVQDLDRGIIIGEKTYGKGLVQTTRPLSYNTQLKVTTAKYYIPSGRCIQAIDYSHRNKDGSVGKIPDSLKSSFKTKEGREVFDGGGIEPDIKIELELYSNIAATLLSKNLIFDFATNYRNKHNSIASPKDFIIDDELYESFIQFLSDKDYDYKTKSEKLLADLSKSVKDEKYFTAVEKDLNDLESKIKKDKKKDLYKNKDEIIELLTKEIVSRYYYAKGRIRSSFKFDKEVNKATELLNDDVQYTQILSTIK